jgi:hypothetical protein
MDVFQLIQRKVVVHEHRVCYYGVVTSVQNRVLLENKVDQDFLRSHFQSKCAGQPKEVAQCNCQTHQPSAPGCPTEEAGVDRLLEEVLEVFETSIRGPVSLFLDDIENAVKTGK